MASASHPQLLEEVFASKRVKKGDRGDDGGEAFLKEYIAKKMWIGGDGDDSDDDGEGGGGGGGGVGPAAEESEDEEEVERQEEFETNYNFRFEEPSGANSR